jgi:hypothetical protein
MKGELIGAFRNDWRGRWVRIFEDTNDPMMVYTEGTLIRQHTCHSPSRRAADCPACNPAEAIHTHEPRADFAAYIGSFNKVYK